MSIYVEAPIPPPHLPENTTHLPSLPIHHVPTMQNPQIHYKFRPPPPPPPPRTHLALTLLSLLALSHTTAFRTTITTTVVEEENPRGSHQQQGGCREQMQRQQQLRQCQMFLSQQRRQYELAMTTDDKNQQQQQQQQFRECCRQLERMDEQCRCPNLREAVRQQLQEGQLRGEERQRMAQRAEDLTERCDLSPRRCEIRTALF